MFVVHEELNVVREVTASYCFFPWASIVCLSRSTALGSHSVPSEKKHISQMRLSAHGSYLHGLGPWSRVAGLDTVAQQVPSEGSFTMGLEQLPKFHKIHIKLQHKAM